MAAALRMRAAALVLFAAAMVLVAAPTRALPTGPAPPDQASATAGGASLAEQLRADPALQTELKRMLQEAAQELAADIASELRQENDKLRQELDEFKAMAMAKVAATEAESHSNSRLRRSLNGWSAL